MNAEQTKAVEGWPTDAMVKAGMKRMFDEKRYSAPWDDVIALMFRDMEAAAPKAPPADPAQQATKGEAIFAFLDGSAPLEGVWFGGEHPTRKGKFWWRSVLREAIAAQQAPVQPAGAGIERLRAEQAEGVMPQIGPLLDAWDGMPNDTKAVLREEAPGLVRTIGSINRAMLSDAPVQPPPKVIRTDPAQPWTVEHLKSYPTEALALLNAKVEREGLTDAQAEVLQFLFGVGELRGCGFSERPKGERGTYWWRKDLRAAFPSIWTAPSDGEKGEGK